MAASFASPEDFLASLPPDRQKALAAVRAVIRKNLQKGFEEKIAYGMISYCIPLSRYPDTYNKQPLGVAALGSPKGYMTVHLVSVYADPAERERFEAGYRAAGKKLDMGKGCVRFKKLEDLPLEVIGDTIARITVDGFIARYEAARAQTASGARAAAKKSAAQPKKGAAQPKKGAAEPKKSVAPKRPRKTG